VQNLAEVNILFQHLFLYNLSETEVRVSDVHAASLGKVENTRRWTTFLEDFSFTYDLVFSRDHLVADEVFLRYSDFVKLFKRDGPCSLLRVRVILRLDGQVICSTLYSKHIWILEIGA
jgi:hypothetical protein